MSAAKLAVDKALSNTRLDRTSGNGHNQGTGLES
jgi:hypothetical protein